MSSEHGSASSQGKGEGGLARKSGLRRIALTAIAGLICVAAAAVYLFCTYDRSVGTGPAGPAVAGTRFEKAWTTRPVLLVGLGDSVTAGFGARRGYGYFDRLVANPPEDSADVSGMNLLRVIPNLVASNLAVSGSVSKHLLEEQLPRLPKADPGILGWVVITTGGNDLIHNYGKTPPHEHAMYGATWDQAQPWIKGFEDRMDQILKGIEERFPGGYHVFLANIYDPSDGVGDIERAGLPKWPDGLKILDAYNQVLERAAKRHPNVHLIDMHSAFLGHGIHCNQPWSKHYRKQDPHYWYFTNLEDPNERGYDAIRRLFLNEMAVAAQSAFK